MPKIPVKVVSWQEIVDWSYGLAERIIDSGYRVDVIIAIARGGLVPSRILADRLGVVDVISLKVEHWVQTASRNPEARIKYPYTVDLSGKNVLIVDDIADTGDSLILAKDYAKRNFNPKEIRTATLQVITQTTKYVPDYYYLEVKDWAWFMYPWNYWEDLINLVKKLKESGVNITNLEELKRAYVDSYGSHPPIDLKIIIDEMKRRGEF
ncbi:MAG: phosphoribosyltransferase [Sulfolobales archaeon]|nr:phosphoribosyltransferase [Sulfolobales archaeon]MCG2893708.1 phosphoribosyltransferase [Sulfolobales archaeon]MCG2910671.1 phosphoribosyltransferase [Sulfolobales archaeon]